MKISEKIFRRFSRKAKKTLAIKKRLLFTLAAVALFFFAAEIALRVLNIAGRPDPNAPGVSPNLETSIIDDPQLFWRIKPNQEMEGEGRNFHINSIGLREKEIAVPKPAGEFRILSLGESTTFGAGVDDDQAYTKVAQKILRERYPEKNIRTINAGVGAHTSFQMVTYLEIDGLNLMPDMVWLFSGANDGLASYQRNYANLRHGFGYTDKELFFLRNRFAGLIGVLNHSDLYKILKQIQNGRSLASYKKYILGKENQVKSQGEWKQRVPADDRRENLLRFVTLCKSHDVVPVFLQPVYWDTNELGDNIMRQVAKQTGTRLIDLPRALHQSGQFDSAWYSLEELGGHPNPLGHRLIGQAVAEGLAPEFAN